MKIALFGITTIKPGKHNLKDPRLDRTHELVEADKKTHVQADVVGEDQLAYADVILATTESKADLILKDLEFVETRLSRDPQPAERAALEKIQGLLEQEQLLCSAGLTPEDLQAVAAHSFVTQKPVCVASADDLRDPDALLLRGEREIYLASPGGATVALCLCLASAWATNPEAFISSTNSRT